MRLGDKGTVKVDSIPTGSLALDLALGIGGVPRGRIVEIFGPESSGKTTLVNHIIAQAQALGGVCAFIDTEHAIDPVYSRAIGVDTDELLVSQPDYGEQALQIADRLIASGGGRRGRDRLGRGADPESRARRPDRRHHGRPAGAADVAGDAQTRRQPQPDQNGLHLHQPDPRKESASSSARRRPSRAAGR